MQSKAMSMIGLAKRAGKLVSGEFASLEAVRSGTAALVIIAGDASDGTAKKFKDKCSFYNTKLIVFSSKSELGALLGKEERAVLAVTDEGFAAAIAEKTGIE